MRSNDKALAVMIAEKASPRMDGRWTATAAVPLISGGGPVFYGSIEDRAAAKERLINRLFSRLTPHGGLLSSQDLPALKKDCLGRPFLSWPGASVPAISFSHAKGRMWACLGWAAGIGIDVAYPEEFHDPYPFVRVFRREELGQVKGLCGGGIQDGAALLWSLKEAAVKALGCGFNLFDPLEVEVRVLSRRAGGFLFVVNAGRSLSAWAAREGQAWMAVALIAPS
jgi:phosphopantetheinyl transferase